jgi:hypothetical protein
VFADPAEPPVTDGSITLSTDLYLFLVSQSEQRGYDTFDSFVCAAASEEEARNLNPEAIWGPKKNFPIPIDWDKQANVRDPSWATRRESVEAKLLGVALHGTSPGVICASYCSG